MDTFRPFVSRIIGAAIGLAAGWLSTKTGVVVDAGTQASVTTAVVVGAYGIAHKIIDKKVNPADAASSHLAGDSIVAAQISKAEK